MGQFESANPEGGFEKDLLTENKKEAALEK